MEERDDKASYENYSHAYISDLKKKTRERERERKQLFSVYNKKIGCCLSNCLKLKTNNMRVLLFKIYFILKVTSYVFYDSNS